MSILFRHHKFYKMKNFLVLALALISSYNIYAQFPECADTYGGIASLNSAQTALANLADCYGDNHYACNSVWKSINKADFDLVSAINDAVVGGCTSCNVSALSGLGTQIQIAYDQLKSLGWPQYYSNLIPLISSWSDPKYQCDRHVHGPLDGPDLKGIWEGKTDAGLTSIIEITLDKVRERYIAKIKPSSSGTEYVSMLRYTDGYQIFAENWNASAAVYDGVLVWEGQTWTKKGNLKTSPEMDHTKKGVYVIKVSGAGYGRNSGFTKVKGDHVLFYNHNKDEDIKKLFKSWNEKAKEESHRGCVEKSGPLWQLCPCPSHPLVWTDGPYYEVLDYYKTINQKMYDKYQCDHSYHNILCANWVHEEISYDELPCNKK